MGHFCEWKKDSISSCSSTKGVCGSALGVQGQADPGYGAQFLPLRTSASFSEYSPCLPPSLRPPLAAEDLNLTLKIITEKSDTVFLTGKRYFWDYNPANITTF